MPYTLAAKLTRHSAEYGPIECDVLIDFDVTLFVKGYASDRIDPGVGDEYEFEFLDAAFDGEPDDAPGPMTESEIALMRGWLEDHYEQAAAECADYAADWANDIADRATEHAREG